MRYLIDKSALVRWGKPAAKPLLDELSERALLAVTGAVEYEMLFSARNVGEAARIKRLLYGFDYVRCTDEVWDRVVEVQQLAIAKGIHRSLSMADLIIAATAERHGLVVLHYDGDYDMIAALTGQVVRWVAAPGTAD
ncbi:PIN domain nuclease [Yinghuangia soli]|uniref:PIN domain nuclease n=1 Tax=Yinghuangia soli TaxID=2908204 RepID=UPI00355744D0